MSRISKVEFKLAANLPQSVRDANGLADTDFAELRVENSDPHLVVEKVTSPAKRVNGVLKSEGVKIRL